MGRAPCCDKANVKKGPWSPEEDTLLRDYLHKHGTGGNWISLPQKAGLRRCGKSCRLRWLNYLRPNIKHGEFSDEEDRIICSFFASIGSRWSIIAAQLPGRTDNDIKNYWNTKLKKKFMAMMMMNYSTSSSSSSSSQIRAPNQLKNNYQSPPNLLDQSPSPPPYNNTTQSYNSFSIPSSIQSQEVEESVLMFGGSSSSINDVYGGVNEGLEEIKQLISTNNVCNYDNNNDFNFLVDYENNKTEEQVMFYYYYYY